MRLLHGQYNLFTRKEDKEIKVLAEFSAIYYGVWFLITPLTASAPRNDLQAIHQMRVLRPFRKQEATACLESWERHLDYLSPPLLFFCLLATFLLTGNVGHRTDGLVDSGGEGLKEWQ